MIRYPGGQPCAGRLWPLFFALATLLPLLPFHAGAADLSSAIVQVAKQAIPAVVHIDVTERQEVDNPLAPFSQFFGERNVPKRFKREVKGVGTGIIIDAQGNIVTNHHVAGGATSMEVLLSNGNKYPAKLVGSDPKTDLAVIRISAREKLPFLAFGDSDKTEVGEWVVAIGHPMGLDQTVTQGIISAKHRRGLTDPTSYQDFLQTDASINPGNSGGPLLNLRGEVIGVNAAIASQSGGSEGIGFAIPSNMAMHIAKTLIAKGKVERGWLGVSITDITPEQAPGLGLQSARNGAMIADVVKGGPAERGGLRKGDVVTAYQGRQITDSADLRNEVANSTIGSDVKMTVLREKKRQDVTVRIGSPQEALKWLAAEVKSKLGGDFRAMNPREAQAVGVDGTQGVVVTSVDPKGPLGQVGFEAGDMIVAMNGQPLAGLEGFVQMAASLNKGQKVTLLAVDHRSREAGTVTVVSR